jgi:HlyD family secretion protein
MKKKLIALAVLIILCAAAWSVRLYEQKNPDELTLFGNIEIRQVDLSFQVNGKIKEMLKEEGDAVAPGELVAVLDERDYKANYEKSIAEVSRTLAVKDNSQMLYDRQTPLCSDSTVSKQDCDTLTNNRNESASAYESAVSSRDFAKNQLDYTRVYAPAHGIVMTRVQEPGAVVGQGQPIYTMSKDKPVWIRTYVAENHLGNVKYGMKARVLTDSVDPNTGKKREYTGWVGYISPVAEFTPKTVQTEDLRTDLVYRIRVYVFEDDKFLRQGMPTTVKINLHETDIDADIRNKIEESD